MMFCHFKKASYIEKATNVAFFYAIYFKFKCGKIGMKTNGMKVMRLNF